MVSINLDLVIVMIIIIIVIVQIISQMRTKHINEQINEHINEQMELKTNCDDRDQGCMIICQSAKDIQTYNNCFKACQKNSTIC
jgi:hypothetical protein